MGSKRRRSPSPARRERPTASAKQIIDCRNKQRFESEREADNAAYRKRMEGIRVSFYRCEWCSGWHLTSRSAG